MKKMMMILALLFAMVGSSFGGNVAKNVKISQIRSEGNSIRVVFTGGNFSPSEDLPLFETVFKDNTVEGQRKLAILLSALQSQNTVELWTDGTVELHGNWFNKLNAVYINKL